MPPVGTCRPLIGSDGDIGILCRGIHYKIPQRMATRLREGLKETDVYHIRTGQRAGSIRLLRKEYYRLKLNQEPAFCNRNRLHLLINGTYWYTPVSDWCSEVTV